MLSSLIQVCECEAEKVIRYRFWSGIEEEEGGGRRDGFGHTSARDGFTGKCRAVNHRHRGGGSHPYQMTPVRS